MILIIFVVLVIIVWVPCTLCVLQILYYGWKEQENVNDMRQSHDVAHPQATTVTTVYQTAPGYQQPGQPQYQQPGQPQY